MIKYKEEIHKTFPHVINVSGGRSSGLILMRLLDEKLLDAKRGDVCIFNNTSAEHPETYKFLQRLTEITEGEGIPFIWTEFCTFEKDNGSRIPSRAPTYRMVKPIPFDAITSPDGFRFKGEVFEESISYRGFVPSRQNRMCTSLMKVNVKIHFLADWFSQEQSTPRQGHMGNQPTLDLDTIWETHKSRRGRMSKEDLYRFKKHLLESDHIRHAQSFAQFSNVGKKHHINDVDPLFLGCIGIRYDEPSRIKRLEAMVGNEIIYAPLFDNEIDKKKVIEFWKQYPTLDLNLPYDTQKSNCVYCFMKGANALRKISQDDDGKGDTPASIKWWSKIEKKYQRQSKKAYMFGDKIEVEGEIRGGFFGAYSTEDPNAPTYDNIENAPDTGLPCQCFD